MAHASKRRFSGRLPRQTDRQTAEFEGGESVMSLFGFLLSNQATKGPVQSLPFGVLFQQSKVFVHGFGITSMGGAALTDQGVCRVFGKEAQLFLQNWQEQSVLPLALENAVPPMQEQVVEVGGHDGRQMQGGPLGQGGG